MRNPGGKEFSREHWVCFLKGRRDRRPADKNRLKPACAREQPSPWSPKESPSPPGPGLPAKTGGGQEQKKNPLLSWKSGVSMVWIFSPPYRPMIYLLGSTWLRRISSYSFEGVGVLTISFAFSSGKPQFACTWSKVEPSCKDSTRMRFVVSSYPMMAIFVITL